MSRPSRFHPIASTIGGLLYIPFVIGGIFVGPTLLVGLPWWAVVLGIWAGVPVFPSIAVLFVDPSFRGLGQFARLFVFEWVNFTFNMLFWPLVFPMVILSTLFAVLIPIALACLGIGAVLIWTAFTESTRDARVGGWIGLGLVVVPSGVVALGFATMRWREKIGDSLIDRFVDVQVNVERRLMASLRLRP